MPYDFIQPSENVYRILVKQQQQARLCIINTSVEYSSSQRRTSLPSLPPICIHRFPFHGYQNWLQIIHNPFFHHRVDTMREKEGGERGMFGLGWVVHHSFSITKVFFSHKNMKEAFLSASSDLSRVWKFLETLGTLKVKYTSVEVWIMRYMLLVLSTYVPMFYTSWCTQNT